VEVLLAGAVLTVTALTLLTMFTASGRSSVSGVRRATATWYAHTVVERLRARADQGAIHTAGRLADLSLTPKPPEGFAAVLEAEPVSEDLTAVTVRVSWREGLRGRELTLSTLFSRRGALAAWTRQGGVERPTYPADGGP
jgi:Tfp pilus assembly protein PilV